MHQERCPSFGNPPLRYDQDDNVLSVLISTSVIAATVVVIFLYETTRLYDVTGYILLPVLGFMLYVTSVIFWIVLKVLVRRRRSFYIRSITKYHSVINLVLTFLWISSLGTSVFSIFSTVVHVQCAIQDLPDRLTQIADCSYRLMKATFMLIQTIVLSELSKLRLKRTKLIQSFFLFILLTNTSAWIYNVSHAEKLTSVNSTLCYWNTSLSTKIIIPLHTIMLSVEQEYSFLSVCVISSLFLSNNRMIHVCLSSGDNDPRNLTSCRLRKPSRRLVFYFVVTLLLHLPSLVILILRKSLSYQILSNAWECSTMVTNCILLLIIFYGFHILRHMNQNTQSREIQSDYAFDNDAVYLVCACGTATYAAVGVCFDHFRQGVFGMKAMKYILFLVETFYQTIFILYLKKYRRECNKRLQFIIVYLLFSNTTTWIIFQFLVYSVSYSNINEVFGPLHPAAKHVLYASICLYRFQSCIYLLKLYKQEENEQTPSSLENISNQNGSLQY